jgi:hypothetical protein
MNEQAPIRFACAAGLGAQGMDQRWTRIDSLKNARLSAGQVLPVRLRTNVRPTGGRVHLDQTAPPAKSRPARVRKTVSSRTRLDDRCRRALDRTPWLETNNAG